MTSKAAKTKAPRTSGMSKVSQVFTQARESLKLLETLEKETFAKARTLVKNPLQSNRKRLANEKILAKLRALGVASRSEVEALERKVSELQADQASLREEMTQIASKRPKAASAAKPAEPTTETFPNT